MQNDLNGLRFTSENYELMCQLSNVRAEKEVAETTLSHTLDDELRSYKHRKILLCAREEKIIEKQIELKTAEQEWHVLAASDDHPQKQAELDAHDAKESRLRNDMGDLECELPEIRNARNEVEEQIRKREVALAPKGSQSDAGIPWPGSKMALGRFAIKLYEEKLLPQTITSDTAAIKFLCSFFLIDGEHPKPENIRSNLSTEKSRNSN